MMANILMPAMADFVHDHWSSASHRRMFFLGQIVLKITGMFKLTEVDEVPDAARVMFVLYLEGMESGDAEVYARFDAEAARIYQEWLAGREVH
ncbi:hypothetical protein V1318_13170 [Lysobacter sp. CCNWLW3]|uniref:hypothetical protein n=1 Tax=unclassified Lysobacter TaxID=2635362 RepID=UPI002FD43040